MSGCFVLLNYQDTHRKYVAAYIKKLGLRFSVIVGVLVNIQSSKPKINSATRSACGAICTTLSPDYFAYFFWLQQKSKLNEGIRLKKAWMPCA
jgi:hypothetical protein